MLGLVQQKWQIISSNIATYIGYTRKDKQREENEEEQRMVENRFYSPPPFQPLSYAVEAAEAARGGGGWFGRVQKSSTNHQRHLLFSTPLLLILFSYKYCTVYNTYTL